MLFCSTGNIPSSLSLTRFPSKIVYYFWVSKIRGRKDYNDKRFQSLMSLRSYKEEEVVTKSWTFRDAWTVSSFYRTSRLFFDQILETNLDFCSFETKQSEGLQETENSRLNPCPLKICKECSSSKKFLTCKCTLCITSETKELLSTPASLNQCQESAKIFFPCVGLPEFSCVSGIWLERMLLTDHTLYVHVQSYKE
jgi:hypothetical protein